MEKIEEVIHEGEIEVQVVVGVVNGIVLHLGILLEHINIHVVCVVEDEV